jgi:hypothetical protein
VLTSSALVNGALLLNHRLRNVWASQLAIPTVAAFYALVSLYLEGSLYLYYSVGLTLVALVWQLTSTRARALAATAGTLTIATTAIAFHAGQPRDRASLDILNGVRTARFGEQTEGPNRSGLRMSAGDASTYDQLIRLVHQWSSPADEIFAFPNDAELYFLAGRRNPFRFYNSALGLQRPADLEATMTHLEANPPAIVLFRPGDKYNNNMSARVMDLVRERYARVESFAGIELYVPRSLESHGTGSR